MDCENCLFARVKQQRVSCLKGFFANVPLGGLSEASAPENCKKFHDMREDLDMDALSSFRLMVRRVLPRQRWREREARMAEVANF